MKLKSKIEAANTLKSINKLRLEVVENMTSENGLLELWQDKYWSLKKCPTCGHIK